MDWSRVRAILTVVAPATTIVVGSIAIAKDWGDIREHVTSFFEWLYPLGVISLLALALLVALVVIAYLLYEPARAPVGAYVDEREREHDRQIVDDVLRVLPRRNVVWLRDQEFDESWELSDLERFVRFGEVFDGVEYTPYNADLRRAFNELQETVSHFLYEHNENTTRTVMRRGVSVQVLTGAAVLTLIQWAEDVVLAYDDFLKVAHELHILDTPQPAI